MGEDRWGTSSRTSPANMTLCPVGPLGVPPRLSTRGLAAGVVRRGDATTDHAEPATGLRAGAGLRAGLSRDAATSVTAAFRAAAKLTPASPPLEPVTMGARLPCRSRVRPLGVLVPDAWGLLGAAPPPGAWGAKEGVYGAPPSATRGEDGKDPRARLTGEDWRGLGATTMWEDGVAPRLLSKISIGG